LTPPPKNRNIQKDEGNEDEKNKINEQILNENTNNNK
jgi:hypothetical protein